MKIIFLFFFITVSQFVFSQVPALEKEPWAEKPSVSRPDNKYQQDPAVIVLDKMTIEYIDNKNKELEKYLTVHEIVHLNNDHGIEYFNKIYINVNEFSDVVNIKARSILPGGKIVNIDQANIKDLKEENGSLYKIFAFEGLESGSDIEYVYTIRRTASLLGKIRIQGKHPVIESVSAIISPTRLVFDIKPIHCKPEAQTDTLRGEKTRILVRAVDIKGLEEEKYSSYEVNRGRIEYKLSYNNALHPGERIFTWNQYAKQIFAVYGAYTDKELKKVSDLISENKWDQLSTDSTKIITVENYIKKNIVYRKDLDGKDEDIIETILKTGVATSTGLMRLYGAIFRTLGINYQFVLAGDHDDEEVDRNFENWDNCSNPMFYFPVLRRFLVPTRIHFRYPLVFPYWADGNAIFCKNVSIGSMTSAIAEIKYIPLEGYLYSYTNLESNVSINSTADSLLIDMKYIYGGYSAPGVRYNFDYLTPEEERNAIKGFSKQFMGTETILSSSLENRAFEDANSGKPFILNIKVKAGDLIEKAGNKILVKVGLLIGPQVEMYQEKERQLPIAVTFPHVENRKILLTIPDGYQVRNPDDLKLNQVYQENGVQTMGFVSNYTLNENVITIDIMEDYRKTHYPLSQYEDFRKIINTSSDFNKIVLILEKK